MRDMVAKKCKHWHAPAQRLLETRVHNDMPYGCLDEHSIALVENSCIALRAHDPNAGQLCVSVQHIEIEGSRRIQDLAWVDKGKQPRSAWSCQHAPSVPAIRCPYEPVGFLSVLYASSTPDPADL